MSRERIAAATVITAAWLTCACAGGSPGGPNGGGLAGLHGAAAGSNVVLISIDTLRAGHLRCYGSDDARTPNLDALAARGVRFEQAVSSAPITLPAHATLMTGLAPPNHGVRLNGTFRLAEDRSTLAEALRSNGYATAAVVGAFVLDARYGLAQGFDHYDDDFLPELGTVDETLYSARPADAVTRAATAWIEQHVGSPEPFFLWVHYYDPHFPYEPPAPYAETFADRPYDGEIAFVDDQVGELMAVLRDRGLLADTVVIVVGDHGEGLGDHGEATHLDLIYDATMHVPMIVSGPSIPAGEVVRDRVVGLVDVAPTVLGLLGVEALPEASDGVDLTTAAVDDDRAIYIESLAGYLDYGWAPLKGLRRAHDKLIHGPDPEYFDLRSDPDELDNLYSVRSADASDLQSVLERRLRRWDASDGAARDSEIEIDEQDLDRLTALGYIRRSGEVEDSGADPKAMLEVGNRIQAAIEMSSRGDLEGALRTVESVLEEHPEAPRALYTAMSIYDMMGRFEDGERTLRRALAVRPNAEGWVHQAWYALMRRDFALFETSLARAEALDPQDGWIYMMRGHRATLEGRLSEAVELFEKAAEVDPVRAGAEARKNIGILEDSLKAREQRQR